jgi:hypothetical protein
MLFLTVHETSVGVHVCERGYHLLLKVLCSEVLVSLPRTLQRGATIFPTYSAIQCIGKGHRDQGRVNFH